MSAVILGPKLGSFYANLMGSHGYLTMDRWFSRTINRYRGQLLSKPTKVGLERFRQLLIQPELTDEETIMATIPYQQAYEERGFKNGSEIEKAANTIHKASFGQLNDTPRNGSDREFMINTVKRAQRNLKKGDIDLTIADIQAILWYYEKRLYGELGARASADISFEEAANRSVKNIDIGETVEIEGPGGNIVDVPVSVSGINLEFAPDPRDKTLTEAFDRLSPKDKRAATYDIANLIIPKTMDELGIDKYEVNDTTGGFENETNPSLNIEISGLSIEELNEVGKVLGYVASQQAIITYDESTLST